MPPMGAILACAAARSIACLGSNVALMLLFGAPFQFFVLLLNASIWIYAPELNSTSIRAFGVAFILAAGHLWDVDGGCHAARHVTAAE
jgi:hypothetical protein